MWGEDNTVIQHLVGLAGSCTFQPDLTVGCRVSNKTGYIQFFVTGKDNKTVFFIPGNTTLELSFGCGILLNCSSQNADPGYSIIYHFSSSNNSSSNYFCNVV
jgi:hypothetical protein